MKEALGGYTEIVLIFPVVLFMGFYILLMSIPIEDNPQVKFVKKLKEKEEKLKEKEEKLKKIHDELKQHGNFQSNIRF